MNPNSLYDPYDYVFSHEQREIFGNNTSTQYNIDVDDNWGYEYKMSLHRPILSVELFNMLRYINLNRYSSYHLSIKTSNIVDSIVFPLKSSLNMSLADTHKSISQEMILPEYAMTISTDFGKEYDEEYVLMRGELYSGEVPPVVERKAFYYNKDLIKITKPKDKREFAIYIHPEYLINQRVKHIIGDGRLYIYKNAGYIDQLKARTKISNTIINEVFRNIKYSDIAEPDYSQIFMKGEGLSTGNEIDTISATAENIIFINEYMTTTYPELLEIYSSKGEDELSTLRHKTYLYDNDGYDFITLEDFPIRLKEKILEETPDFESLSGKEKIHTLMDINKFPNDHTLILYILLENGFIGKESNVYSESKDFLDDPMILEEMKHICPQYINSKIHQYSFNPLYRLRRIIYENSLLENIYKYIDIDNRSIYERDGYNIDIALPVNVLPEKDAPPTGGC